MITKIKMFQPMAECIRYLCVKIDTDGEECGNKEVVDMLMKSCRYLEDGRLEKNEI